MASSTRSCPTCGRRRQVAHGRDPVCPSCRRRTFHGQPTDAHALTGGRWVQVRNRRGDCIGLQVWIPDHGDAA